MNKVVSFLEQHVQWIVLAIASLFVLLMVWWYVLQQPVPVSLGGQEFTPGTVDHEIRDLALRLEERIEPRTDVPPAIPLKSAVAEFEAALGMRDVAVGPVAASVWGSEPLKLPPEEGTPQNPVVESAGAVAELVVPPAVTIVEAFTGRAYVNTDPQALRNPNPAQPTTPGGTPPGTFADKLWTRVNYRIPMGQLNIAFRQAKLPVSSTTLVFDVDLLREEELPDGSFGKPTVVKPIATVTMLPVPNGENPSEAMQFTQWAQVNQGDLLRPPFYPVQLGDDPIFGDPAAQQATDPMQQPGGTQFDPRIWIDSPPSARKPLSELTEEEKQAIRAEQARRLEERRQQQQRDRPQPPPRGGRGGRGGGGGGGGMGGDGNMGDFDVPDDDRPPFYQVRPGTRPPMPPPPPGRGGFLEEPPPGYEGEFGMGEYPGGMPGWGGPQQQNVPNAVQYDPLPQVPFDPAATPDIVGWQYDETAEPGRTYRYAIRYSIRNPLYGTVNAAKDPQFARKLDLVSPPSEWSSPVTTQPLMHLFLAARFAPSAGNVKVKVYRWQEGKQQPTTVTVSPGDPVGGTENGIDYSTGWTLVDIRSEGGGESTKSYALFLDQAGKLVRRDAEGDLNDPVRQKLDAAIAAATPVDPNAPAGPGGVPPPGMPGSGMPPGIPGPGIPPPPPLREPF